MLAGLAISPDTPSSSITDAMGTAADMLLVMTVQPGAGGQKFRTECLPKVKELRERFGEEKNIQVDGGVGPGNICACAEHGANVIVAGTSIFGAASPKDAITQLREGVDKAIAARKGGVKA